MSVFCTKCGTSNEYGALFCESCGASLRPTTGKATDRQAGTQLPLGNPSIPSVTAANPVNQKKILFAGVALAAVLALGGGAMYFVLKPPAATSSTLLAAAKAGYGKETLGRLKNELCLANTDYSGSKFNVGEYDSNTQAWMNALVSAGLYSPPVNVVSGGYFSTNLLQYIATPELEKYREGTRLCLAKNVEITDVIDIEKPSEESLGYGGNSPKVLTVKSKLVFKSIDTAPWLEKSEVRDLVMRSLSGWEYKDKYFQKQVADSFGLREKKWTTGVAYKADLERQSRIAQRGNSPAMSNTGNAETQKSDMFAGITSAWSSIFSFGGHPLKGTWQTGTSNVMGFEMPGGLGGNKTITFTSNSIEVGGQSIKAKFEVEGKRVKVIPDGQAESMTFVMQDNDSATLDLGFAKMQYQRVR